MSEAAFEALESEAYSDAEGEAEGYGGEVYGEAGWEGYSEDSRKRRQQQIMQARQRQRAWQQSQIELRRASQPPRVRPPAPYRRPSPATLTALRAADFDNKVEQDSLRRAVEDANRRATRSMYSAVATGAVGQVLDTYQDDLKDHDFVRAAARFAPLALLPADRKREGLGAVVLHPAFLSAVLIGGIVVIGKVTNAKSVVQEIRMSVPKRVTIGSGKFVATAFDQNGRKVSDAAMTWDSDDRTTLEFTDAKTGAYTAHAAGKVQLKVTVGDLEEFATVKVKPNPIP